MNIAFARGGAHLPIAHALRLQETDIISWGGYFLEGGVFFWGRGFFGFFWGFFFGGGGSLTPFFFGTNLLVRVKLGYTPNFTALGHLEVP